MEIRKIKLFYILNAGGGRIARRFYFFLKNRLDVRVNVRYNSFEVRFVESMNITKARKNLYKLIDDVTESHVPVMLAGKKNSAVIISAEDWNAIQETIYLNSVPGMVESILSADKEPLSACIKLKDIDLGK